jgi:hypothetical protein
MSDQLLPLSLCPDYGTVHITFLIVDLRVACNPELMDGIRWAATLEPCVYRGCRTRSGINSHTLPPDNLVQRHHMKAPMALVSMALVSMALVSMARLSMAPALPQARLPLLEIMQWVLILYTPYYAGHLVGCHPPVPATVKLSRTPLFRTHPSQNHQPALSFRSPVIPPGHHNYLNQ